MGQAILIGSYLFAIVASNLVVTALGQAGLLITGIILIPFDLFSRDILHEKWAGHGLRLKMALLIMAGSILSYLINADSKRIAIASLVAFALAGIIDTVVYSTLRGRPRAFKMNASNLCSGMIDSIVFPMIAFGAFSIWLSSSQTLLKFFGGMVWTWIYIKVKARRSGPMS